MADGEALPPSYAEQELDEIRRYHERYPSSQAFQNWEDGSMSLDERLLEFKLEGLLSQYSELVSKRKNLYPHPDGTQLVLPSNTEFKDLLQIRNDRSTLVSEILAVEEPPQLQLRGDQLRDEIRLSWNNTNESAETVLKLLHYFRSRREILVHKKYRLMLRFVRCCTTRSLITRIQPVFEKRMHAVETEYEEIIKRIERLELLKKEGVTAVIELSDLEVYLRFLVHHYKCTKGVHRFFKRIQFMHHTHRFEVFQNADHGLMAGAASANEKDSNSADTSAAAGSGKRKSATGKGDVENTRIPVLSSQESLIKMQNDVLLSYFNLANAVSDEDGGHELSHIVRKTFSTVFEKQCGSKAFPAYDSTLLYGEGDDRGGKQQQQLSNKSASSALDASKSSSSFKGSTTARATLGAIPEGPKVTMNTVHLKPSTWLTHTSYLPEISESQEKQDVFLRTVKDIDSDLRVEAGFIDSDDANFVMRRLKDMVDSHASRAVGEYSGPKTGQSLKDKSSSQRSPMAHSKGMTTSNKAVPQMEPSQLLSFYFLRHVRTRDFKMKLLNTLNYFRSIHRRLCIDALGFAYEKNETVPAEGDSPSKQGGNSAFGTDPTLESSFYENLPKGANVMGYKGISNRDDAVVIDEHRDLKIRDSFNVYVMYDAAVQDLEALEWEMLRLGSFFLKKHITELRKNGLTGTSCDRIAVMSDLYESEAWFQEAKRKVVECYLEVYEHTSDPAEQRRLGQVITDLIALRPRVDFEDSYFNESYASEIVCLELHYNLVHEIIKEQIDSERKNIRALYSRHIPSHSRMGHPDELSVEHMFSLTPSSSKIGIFDLYGTLSCLSRLPEMLSVLQQEFCRIHDVRNPMKQSGISRCILQQAIIEWRLVQEESRIRFHADHQGDEFRQETLVAEDPIAIALAMKELTSQARAGPVRDASDASGGQDSSKIDMVSFSSKLVMNALEFVELRKLLLDALFETDILSAVYQHQARLMGKEVRRLQLENVTFDKVPTGVADEEDLIFDPNEEVSGIKGELHLPLAILEFEDSMGEFNFHSLAGLKEIIAGNGVEELRAAYAVQVMQKNLLLSVIEANQIPLDFYLKLHWKREEEALLRFQQSGQNTFVTQMRSGMESPSKERRARLNQLKDVADLKRQWHANMTNLSKVFISVNGLKRRIRQDLAVTYANRAAVAQQTGPRGAGVFKVMRKVKYDIVRSYTEQMSEVMYTYALRVQLHDLSVSLARTNADGVEDSPFYVQKNEENLLTELSSMEGKKKVSEYGPVIAEDGSLVNPFFVPGIKEVVRMFREKPWDRQVEGLRACLRVVSSMKDVTELLRTFARFGVPSAHTSIYDNVPLELNKLKSEMMNLPNPQNTPDVVAYLAKRRSILFKKLVVLLKGLSDDYLERGHPSAHVLVRSDLTKLLQVSESSSMYHLHVLAQFTPTIDLSYVYNITLYVGQPLPQLLSYLPRLLCNVSDADMNFAHAMEMSVDLMLEDALSEASVYATSQPLQAVDVHMRLLDICLKLYKAKGRLLTDLMGVPIIDDTGNYETAMGIWESKVFNRALLFMKELRDRSDPSPPAPSKLAQRATPLRCDQNYVPEFEARRIQLECTLQEVSKVELNKSIRQVEELHGLVLGELQNELDWPSELHKRDYLQKVTFLQQFLRQLMHFVVETRTEEGAVAYIVTQANLTDCLDTLSASLYEWAEQRLVDRSLDLELMIQQRNHELYKLERLVTHLQNEINRDRSTLQRRVQTEVTDKGYDLILEIDSLHRKVHSMDKLNKSQGVTIREEVKVEYEDLVRDLSLQILSMKARFKEYRSHLYQEVISDLFEVKKEALTKMVESSSAPVDLKRKTLRVTHVEDELNDLKLENTELKKTILKLKTLNQMKSLAAGATSDRTLRKLEDEKVNLKQGMWALREEVDQREKILRQQLTATQNALSAAEQEMETMRKELELQTRNKNQLVQWKVSRSHRLEELEEKNRKFEKWGNVDVEKLVHELEKRDAEVTRLQNLESKVSRGTVSASSKHEKELKKVKKQLENEKVLKLEAFEKLDDLRSKFARVSMGGGADPVGSMSDRPTEDGMNRTLMWQSRFENAMQHIDLLTRENEVMRSVLNDLGVAPPTLGGSNASAPGYNSERSSTILDDGASNTIPSIGAPSSSHRSKASEPPTTSTQLAAPSAGQKGTSGSGSSRSLQGQAPGTSLQLGKAIVKRPRTSGKL